LGIITKIKPFLLKLKFDVGNQINPYYICRTSQRGAIFKFILKTAEIIPNEPGQVMLPRDKDTQRSINTG